MGKTKSFLLRSCGLFILVTFLGLSTGCSKNTEDIDDIDISQDGRIERAIENLEGETFARIEANIIGDVNESYPTVTLKNYAFTEEDTKAYADTFFDNSEYHNKKYMDEYTVSDIDATIERYNQYKEDIDNNKPPAMPDYADIMNSIDWSIEYYTDLRANAPNDITLRCDTTFAPYEFARDPQPMHYLEGFQRKISRKNQYCILEGMHNDIPYTLTFTRDGKNNLTFLELEISSPDTVVWENFTYDKVSYYSEAEYEASLISEENVCKYTEDEAIAMCNNMINTLQISDMTIINVSDINTINFLSPFAKVYVNETGVCGYEIVYGKIVNNKSINYSNNNIVENIDSLTFIDKGEEGEEYEWGYETLIFSVMDSGVVSVRYGFPTTIESVSPDDTVLLSFNDVILIFENKMIEKYGDDRAYKHKDSNIVINKIQLGLCRVTLDDSDGDCALVPAWDFYSSEYRTRMTINAIDGSIINCYSPNVYIAPDDSPKG